MLARASFTPALWTCASTKASSEIIFPLMGELVGASARPPGMDADRISTVVASASTAVDKSLGCTITSFFFLVKGLALILQV
jgi:hypothetical protein